MRNQKPAKYKKNVHSGNPFKNEADKIIGRNNRQMMENHDHYRDTP